MSTNDKPLEDKRVLVTGGTGSLGKVLVRRLLSGEMGVPKKVTVFSRDEAKQHFMRVSYETNKAVTDEVIYRNFLRTLVFRIGDVRDVESVASALRDADIVINAAAMKQVPTCEYFPYEAVRTNIGGAENIVSAIQRYNLDIDTVIGVSTDKACKPVNVMGMTKAVQERVFIQGNMRCPGTRFVCVRYGNVLASRGSVIPLFHEQIRHGGPLTITTEDMTRFLLSLDDAVDTVFAAIRTGKRGETFIPRAPASRIVDVAKALIGDRDVNIDVIGVRPGEKIHEVLISGEESTRVVSRGNWYALKPMLPEIVDADEATIPMDSEYSSGTDVLDFEGTLKLLKERKLMVDDVSLSDGELLR